MEKVSNSLDTFGSYIRRLRIKNDIGQRELTKQTGVAPSSNFMKQTYGR